MKTCPMIKGRANVCCHPVILHHYRLAQMALHQYKEAKSSFAQALDLEPQNEGYKASLEQAEHKLQEVLVSLLYVCCFMYILRCSYITDDCINVTILCHVSYIKRHKHTSISSTISVNVCFLLRHIMRCFPF